MATKKKSVKPATKTVEPVAEAKAETKEAKIEPVKEVIAEPVKEVIAEPVKEVKTEPVKETKAEPVKETKDETAKTTKTPAKKSTAKTSENVYIQYYGNEVSVAELIEKAKKLSGVKSPKNVNLYVKLEDNAVYYVVDDEKGKIDL